MKTTAIAFLKSMKLTDHPFIQSIPEPYRTSLSQEVEIIELQDQQVIFTQNTQADALYLLLEGEVEFNKARANGTTQLINRASEGQFFGEVGVFTGEKRSLNAIACGPAIVGKMPKATLDKATESSEPTHQILASVISHLRSTTEHYMDEVVQREKLALIGTMLTSLLHDFKGSCSIISLAAHLISKRHKEEPKTIQCCESIENQIQHMVNMVNELAAFPHGDNKIIPQKVSLEKVFNKFCDLKAPLLKDSRFKIEFISNDVEMEGDADKLLRMIQNLVTNAIEAIPPNGPLGQIQVRASESDGMIHLTVQDNGLGIPQEIQGSFFKPFATFGKHNGSGLGTAIAKSIVEAHRGKIHFETSKQGTTISIEIPKVFYH